MPRVTKEQRAIRDRLVWQMFVSGVPYRDIGRHPKVKLSCRGVELSVRRTMETDRPHTEMLTGEARSVLLARLETLLRAAMPRAMDGNMRAVEVSRKLIEQEARVLGVGQPGHNGHDVDPGVRDDEPERDEDGLTALERYRLRHKEQPGDRERWAREAMLVPDADDDDDDDDEAADG